MSDTPELPSDDEIATAEGLGAAAARAQQGDDTCPWPRGTPYERVLRRRWLMGYASEPGGRAQRLLFGTGLDNVKRRARRVARRVWYGADATP